MKEIAGHPTVEVGDGEESLVVVPGLSDAFQGGRESKLTEVLLERYYYRGFTDDYTVRVVSRPSLEPGVTTREMARGYADVLDEVGESDVLGLSLGGLVAQYLGAKHAENVRRLVIGVAGYKLGEGGRRIVEGWREDAEAGDWDEVYIDALETTYSSKYRQKVYGAVARLPVELFEPSLDDFVASCDACLEHDAFGVLDDIEARTLVVGGSDDVLFPDEIVEETARRIPNGELHVVEDAGHGAFDERKKEFDTEVRRFLSEDD
ncbi:MAG: alpha/beta hydrolase [Halobacteriales archaeon]|nr:alpha/beta hydrolase [Halobacteriales archaeon]